MYIPKIQILTVLTVLLSGLAAAQSPEQTVVAMFDAMRAHNGESFLNQFTNTALLERALPGGEVKQSDISKFAEMINKPGRYLDEHLLSITTHQSDNLASVWTPYAFYLDEKLSHCGVNSFQLIKIDGVWKIQYLIDNTHVGDCEAFIELHTH